MLTYLTVFLSTLTIRKITNGILLRFSYFISKLSGNYFHWGNPESLSIEPTNLCNLKCPECPSGTNNMTRPRLFLDTNIYKSIIDQSYKSLSYLQLFFQGEPFLHPKLPDLINYAVTKKVFTSTSTNGQFLSIEQSSKIVKSGLHHLIISVDGTTQEVYEMYRVGGSLEKVIAGINNMVQAKKDLKSTTPIIELQFIVFGTNEHQIPEIKKLAKKLNVNRLSLKTAQIDDYKNGSDLIPKNKKYSRYIKSEKGTYLLNRKKTFRCKRIWYGSVITAENELLPCCFDKNAEFKLESNTQHLNKSWKNSTAKNFRTAVWKKHDEISICNNCSEGLK